MQRRVMRVISGSLRGRQLASPGTDRTHPMGDKVRAALFSVLGDITGLTVLDAFTGSAALAIESISRGAVTAVAIDFDRKAIMCARQNVAVLGLSEAIKIVHANAASWSRQHSADTFDIVLLDSPYDFVNSPLLVQLSKHVAMNGTLVLSVPAGYAPTEFIGLRQESIRRYASAELRFYKRV